MSNWQLVFACTFATFAFMIGWRWGRWTWWQVLVGGSFAVLAAAVTMVFWPMAAPLNSSGPTVVVVAGPRIPLPPDHSAGVSAPADRGPASSSGPQSISDILKAQVDSVSQGEIVFNPPTEMTTGKNEVVTVRISRRTLESKILADLAGSGVVQHEDIQVGEFMAVAMDGDGFVVASKSKTNQFVPPSGFAEWVFNVRPIQAGDQDLLLEASIRYKVGASEEETELPVLTRHIRVKVDPAWEVGFYFEKAEGWKWLLEIFGTAMTGVAGFFAERWFKRWLKGKKPAGA